MLGFLTGMRGNMFCIACSFGPSLCGWPCAFWAIGCYRCCFGNVTDDILGYQYYLMICCVCWYDMIWYHSKPDVVWYGILWHRELVEPRPSRIMKVIRAPTLELKRFPTNQPPVLQHGIWSYGRRNARKGRNSFTNNSQAFARPMLGLATVETWWHIESHWHMRNVELPLKPSEQSVIISLYINNLGSMSNSLSGNQEARTYSTVALFLLHPLRRSQNSRRLPNYWSEAINDVPS